MGILELEYNMILIPARLNSTRLRQKALADIGGLPMIIRTAQACGEDAIVVTDSSAIERVCVEHGVCVMMTGYSPTGIDRCYKAALKLEIPDSSIITIVQGDYPFINITDVYKVWGHPQLHHGAIVTLVKPIPNAKDKHVVKAALTNDDRIALLSRAPIPYKGPHFEHIGIYSMQADTLKKFCTAKESELEKSEDVEGLRAISNNIEIFGVRTNYDYIGVNTDLDLLEARERIKE
jgi:3-deoxy-manno-octulosonate cytidylyltransferase (CMP-KDO synthetase)